MSAWLETHAWSLLFTGALLAAVIIHRDAQLITSALAGDLDARAELLRRLSPIIRARARRFLRRAGGFTESDAEDVVQDVWLCLVKDGGRQLAAYDPGRGLSLENYVGLVAEREVSNQARARRTQKRRGVAAELEDAGQVPAAGASPEEAAEQRELLASLAAHLGEVLEPRDQLVFAYLFVDGLSPEQAARNIGASVQVVYNRAHVIRKLARAFLEAAEAQRTTSSDASGS